jgi:ParB-like chromosome segregation protein Spo0J
MKTKLLNKPVINITETSAKKELDWIKDPKQDFIPTGIQLSELNYVNLRELKQHPLNSYFAQETVEYFSSLREDIRERGIIVPLLAKKDGTLLAGHNRLIIAQELYLEKVPVQFVESELSQLEERKFIFKDNLLRRQLSAKDKENLIRQLYSNEITLDFRGGDRKSPDFNIRSSSELSITLPKKIELETGITEGTAKRILAQIRKGMKNDGGEKNNKKNINSLMLLKYLQRINRMLDNDSNILISQDIKSEINELQNKFDSLLIRSIF